MEEKENEKEDTKEVVVHNIDSHDSTVVVKWEFISNKED